MLPSRHFEDIFRLRLQKTSPRRVDQDEYVRLGHTLQKMSSRRLDQDEYICRTHTYSRRHQDVLPRRLQDVFKTSSRRP